MDNKTSKDVLRQRFIDNMEKKYPGRFLYHDVVYVNAHTKVSVQCTVCNEFSLITPNKLISQGSGCIPCTGRYNYSSVENFVKKSRSVHGDKYGYDRVISVTRGSDKVQIYCPVHDYYFETTATSHANHKSGCPKCGGSEQLTNDSFAEKGNEVHPGKYAYDKVNYINNKTKVSIFCCTCNEYFDITPASFLFGRGCAKCAKYGFQPNKPAVLYVLEITHPVTNLVYYKIGITGDMETRMRMQRNSTALLTQVIIHIDFSKGSDALAIETEVKRQCTLGVLNREDYGDGHSETMTAEEYEKIRTIMEEFNGMKM